MVRRHLRASGIRAAALTLGCCAVVGVPPAVADCIGDQAFNSFTTDVQATNAGAYVMYESAEATTLSNPLADGSEDNYSMTLYSLPPGAGRAHGSSLDVRRTFTAAPTLFSAGGAIHLLVWRAGPARTASALLTAQAGHRLASLVSPAGAPGFAPLAVTGSTDGSYTLLMPAAGNSGPASLQRISATGSPGASTSTSTLVPPSQGAESQFALAQAANGTIWVAGPGLLGYWAPGQPFAIVGALPDPQSSDQPVQLMLAADGSAWALAPADASGGEQLVHAQTSGVISRQKVPNQEGEDLANSEILSTARLIATSDGRPLLAYGTGHGAYLATPAVGGQARRLSRSGVLSLDDLDVQPGTGTVYVAVTTAHGAYLYAAGARGVRTIPLAGVRRRHSSIRPTLGFAPNGSGWVVWTFRRGDFCAGTEDSQLAWAQLRRSGKLARPRVLADQGALWVLG